MRSFRQRILAGIGISMVAVIILLAVQVEVNPPDDTRLILERSILTYISPPCFNQAVVTNNLSESIYGKVKELGFTPDSLCTEQSLKGASKPLLMAWLEKLGLKESNWNW